MKDYYDLANTLFEKMSNSQEQFISKFDIESYSKWFYDQESELIRLYNDDGSEIYFKYIPVGSYALISNTWMWSWENKGSIEAHKNETLKVKEFGEQSKYKFLTDGLFECEREQGWNFTAISKEIIGGIGVYCTNSRDLLKYIIIKGPYLDLESKKIRKMKQLTVDCSIHGFRRPGYVCHHLNLDEPKGFEEAFESEKGMDLEEDDAFAAWCNACEKVRIDLDGWNDASEKYAQFKLACEECYFELKDFNKTKTKDN